MDKPGVDLFLFWRIQTNRCICHGLNAGDSPGRKTADRKYFPRLDKNEKTRLGSRSGASEVKQHKWFSKINWGLLRNTRPPVGAFHGGQGVVRLTGGQIVPTPSNGQDAAHFRSMKESRSLHLDLEGEGGEALAAGLLADDGQRAEDLFGAFSSVTLHYDGDA